MTWFGCRTQDKAILESAYNANPKPDKAARLDIVKRVTLNEKEVQVSLTIDSSGRAYERVNVPNLRQVQLFGTDASCYLDLVPKPPAE